jgi:DNA-binding MarR family transcriptional regulator
MKIATTAPAIPRHRPGAELASVFEQMMMQLTLLGHTLPKSAGELTPQQLKILFTLDFLAAPTAMSKLSAKLGVTPGTLTRVAGRLLRRGYLERKRSTEDDRVVQLSLTKQGQRAVARIKKYRRDFFAELCGKLSVADCETLLASHRYILETYRRIVYEKKGDAKP